MDLTTCITQFVLLADDITSEEKVILLKEIVPYGDQYTNENCYKLSTFSSGVIKNFTIPKLIRRLNRLFDRRYISFFHDKKADLLFISVNDFSDKSEFQDFYEKFKSELNKAWL